MEIFGNPIIKKINGYCMKLYIAHDFEDNINEDFIRFVDYVNDVLYTVESDCIICISLLKSEIRCIIISTNKSHQLYIHLYHTKILSPEKIVKLITVYDQFSYDEFNKIHKRHFPYYYSAYTYIENQNSSLWNEIPNW
jgi:hypothetical protein